MTDKNKFALPVQACHPSSLSLCLFLSFWKIVFASWSTRLLLSDTVKKQHFFFFFSLAFKWFHQFSIASSLQGSCHSSPWWLSPTLPDEWLQKKWLWGNRRYQAGVCFPFSSNRKSQMSKSFQWLNWLFLPHWCLQRHWFCVCLF